MPGHHARSCEGRRGWGPRAVVGSLRSAPSGGSPESLAAPQWCISGAAVCSDTTVVGGPGVNKRVPVPNGEMYLRFWID